MPALPSPPPDAGAPWSRAEDLPDGLSPRWREAEALRRLAEDRAAGAEVLVLRTFLAPAFAEVCAREVRAMGTERIDTPGAAGHRRRIDGGLGALQALLSDPDSRAVLGALLGASLAGPLALEAWRLDPGDHLATPLEQPGWAAGFVLGLDPGWTAADGGAVAWTTADGSDTRHRFLPQLGDLRLACPRPDRAQHVAAPTRPCWLLVGGWGA